MDLRIGALSREQRAALREKAQALFEASKPAEAAAMFELLLQAGDHAPEVLLSYALTLCLLERTTEARRFRELGLQAAALVKATPEQRSVLDHLATVVGDRLPGGRKHADAQQASLWGAT
jgi:hypothetical protein